MLLMWLRHWITAPDSFMDLKKIELCRVKFNTRPLVKLLLSDINGRNWHIFQKFIFILVSISDIWEEKINIWQFWINFTTFNHNAVTVEYCSAGRVKNSPSVMRLEDLGFVLVVAIVEEDLLWRFSHNCEPDHFIQTKELARFRVILWPDHFDLVFF